MIAPPLDITIADLIDGWPSARAALARHGMACVGCAMAPFETLAEAAEAYDLDPAELIRDILEADQAAVTAPRTLRPRKDARSRSIHHSRRRRSSS